jgi:thiamine-phosphate pyrophosphorylase
MPRFPRRGLYAITPESLRGAPLIAAVGEALAGGAAAIQYRDKSADTQRREADAAALLALCERHGVPLIVNDDVELARRIRAPGVHVGREDASLEKARRLLGDHAIVGVSCYDRLELALSAQRAGADYVAFGSFFPSRTKPAAVRADVALVAAARREIEVPIVGIGGITAANAPALAQAGVDVVAVVEAVFGAEDVRTAARELTASFESGHTASSR